MKVACVALAVLFAATPRDAFVDSECSLKFFVEYVYYRQS